MKNCDTKTIFSIQHTVSIKHQLLHVICYTVDTKNTEKLEKGVDLNVSRFFRSLWYSQKYFTVGNTSDTAPETVFKNAPSYPNPQNAPYFLHISPQYIAVAFCGTSFSQFSPTNEYWWHAARLLCGCTFPFLLNLVATPPQVRKAC